MTISNTVIFKPVRTALAFILCAIISLGGLCGSAFSQLEAKTVHRSLADGVMKTIKPDFKFQETYTDKEVAELTSLGPDYDWAKLRYPNKNNAEESPITCLEFQFKVPRIIEINLPTAEGRIVKTPVWYVIYNVTNKKWIEEDTAKLSTAQENVQTRAELEKLDFDFDFGSTIFVEEIDKGRHHAKAGESTITFTPQFVLGAESLPFPKPEQYVVTESIIPLALPEIIKREDPNRHFETTISMADRKIEPGETVWGIAMWKGIDPDIKEFSIYVSGLSNTYLWDVDKERIQPGVVGSGYQMSRKTLKLNFWAPGAADHLLDKEIQYGPKPEVLKTNRDKLINQEARRFNPATQTFDGINEKNKERRPPVDFEWVYR